MDQKLAARKPTFATLPVELLTEIVSFLDSRSLCRLGRTSSLLYSIAFNETVWAHRLRDDYNFPVRVELPLAIGWKMLCSRIPYAKIYLWGANASNGRLAIPLEDLYAKFHRTRGSDRKGFEQPLEMKRTKSQNKELGRIVQVITGGWNCHAITSKGKVLAWGQMNGEASRYAGGIIELVPITLLFDRETPVVSLSSGRIHALALDADGGIREWRKWDDTAYITEPTLQEEGILQLEAGWYFSSALTKTGRVFVWWLDLSRRIEMPVEQRHSRSSHREGHDEYTSMYYNIQAVELPCTKSFIQIGAGDNFIVALTAQGEIYRFNLKPTGEGADLPNIKVQISQAVLQGERYWEYLPAFSEMDKIRDHPVYKDGTVKPPSQSAKISYIDAHFLTFVAYTQGANNVVLMGNAESTIAEIKPSLQNRGIVKVTQGDWHSGAVTDIGELLVWGDDNGALGLQVEHEHVPRKKVVEPQAVFFGKDMFVINADFAGWHSSALVIDISDNPPVELEDVPEETLVSWVLGSVHNLFGRATLFVTLIVFLLALARARWIPTGWPLSIALINMMTSS